MHYEDVFPFEKSQKQDQPQRLIKSFSSKSNNPH